MERGELEVARAPSRAPWGFLAQAVSLLAASLDLETTLANVVQLAVPALADWCGIDLIEPDGSMRPIAGMHSDPQRQRLLDELQRRYGDQRIGTMARVTETGHAELVAEVTDEMLAGSARDAEHLDLLRAVGAQSYMVVPLRARGRLLGTMVLLSTHPARHYGEDDLAAAEELASGCALAVDNARLFTEARDAEKRKDEGLALLDGLFANAPVGLGFLDTQLRYVRINRKLAEINGRTIDDHLGQRVDAVIGGDLGAQVARDCRGDRDRRAAARPRGHRRARLPGAPPGVAGQATTPYAWALAARSRASGRWCRRSPSASGSSGGVVPGPGQRGPGPVAGHGGHAPQPRGHHRARAGRLVRGRPARQRRRGSVAPPWPTPTRPRPRSGGSSRVAFRHLEDEAGFGRTIRSGCSELLPQVPDHVVDGLRRPARPSRRSCAAWA